MTAKRTALFNDERCFWHTPAGAFAGPMAVGPWVQPLAAGGMPETPESRRRLLNLAMVSGLGRQLLLDTAPPAAEEDLLRVHPRDYIDQFKRVSDAGGGPFGDYSPAGPGTYEIAKLSAGLAIGACSAVLGGDVRNAYALCRPPGHHCLPNRAMGFCYLSNIAIAVEASRKKFGLERIAVVDWDVHHGNGTQAVFYERADVLTISLHQDRCFPPGYSGREDRGEGPGKGFNLNLPLPPGSGDAAYLRVLHEIVVPALSEYKPELIIVACGLDANAFDPLARMQLTSDGYRRMTRTLVEAAETLCNGHLVLVHEGGYSEYYVPFCGLAVLEELSGIRTTVVDPMQELINLQQPDGLFLDLVNRYIDDLARPR